MHRGYIKLWRKILDNPILKQPGKRFSRHEAWEYLCLNASGTDTDDLKRGEFRYSIRFLAGVWNWGRGVVERFMRDLEQGPKPMIMRVGQQTGQETGQQTGQFEGHFIICNYETYNPRQDNKRDTKRDSRRDSKRDKSNEVSNELFNEKRKQPAAPTPPKPVSDPRYSPLKTFIESEYLRIRQVKLLSDQSDWTQFSTMLKETNGSFTMVDLQSAWTSFLKSPDPFHQKQGHPLRYWCGNLNAFVGQHTTDESQDTSWIFGSDHAK